MLEAVVTVVVVATVAGWVLMPVMMLITNISNGICDAIDKSRNEAAYKKRWGSNNEKYPGIIELERKAAAAKAEKWWNHPAPAAAPPAPRRQP